MKIRKPVNELTLDDFQNAPVWEFALDEEGDEGQDETTVRPYEYTGELNPSDGMFVVRTNFRLADGTLMYGYMTPPFQGDMTLGTLQPVIVTNDGQVYFWSGMIAPSDEEIKRSYDRLGKIATEVFPIEFEPDISLQGESISGQLSGFIVLENFRTGETRVLI